MAAERKTADERREAVLEAAFAEFAQRGFDGASTDAIARAAGISQPYLFRLFRTKKELFLAATARCENEVLALFRRAAEGKSGEEALHAIGNAYTQMIAAEPDRLRMQLQSYAACDDPDVCAIVRAGFGDLVDYVQRVSRVDPERVMRFFAKGMLLNVIVAMNLLESDEPWARSLVEAVRADKG
jgi:AcrR family transcriptional regulator